MKRLCFALLFVMFFGISLFSQENNSGSIIGNFVIGGSTVSNSGYSTGFVSIGFDIDLVSKAGLQLTFGDTVNISFENGIYQNIYFGAGYHFVKEKYHIGGSLVFIPDGNIDILVGAKVDGGYLFTKNIGISALLLFTGGVMNVYSLFNGGLGLTIRI